MAGKLKAKVKELKASTKEKKEYLKYYKSTKASGKTPSKYGQWKSSRKSEPVYFKGIKKESYESQFKNAGIDWEKDKPSSKLKGK